MPNNQELLDFEEDLGPINPASYTANGGQRFLNFILDRVAVFLIYFSIIYLLDNFTISDSIFVLLVLMVLPGYYILPEYFWGKTLAKFLTKTSVVNLRGERPSLLRIIGRNLCRLIPFEQFSFLGSRAIGWHDTISETRVVQDDFFNSNSHRTV